MDVHYYFLLSLVLLLSAASETKPLDANTDPCSTFRCLAHSPLTTLFSLLLSALCNAKALNEESLDFLASETKPLKKKIQTLIHAVASETKPLDSNTDQWYLEN